MWSPTHVQVTVQRAKNLRSKGRGDTNDAFVLIQMGKEKFQTSVKEKCISPQWYEECDLAFQKMDSEVVFVIFHRNLLSMDEFLGEVSVPLTQVDGFDRTLSKWFPLGGRGGKKDGKNRGEIEVKIGFVVRSSDTQSLNDFSMGKKRRTLKGLATSVSHKLQKIPSRSFSLRIDSFDPRSKLSKLRERKNSSSSNHSNEVESAAAIDSLDSEGFDDFDSSAFKTVPMKPSRKFNSLYSSTLSLPQSAMITSSIQEDKSLEDEIDAVHKEGGEGEISDSSDTSDGNQSPKKVPRRLSNIDGFDTKSPMHGEWTQRISSRMKGLTRSEINLSEVSRNDISSTKEKRSALESIRNTLRRHTLQLAEPPDLSSLKILGSPKKNRASELKKGARNIRESTNHPNDISAEALKQYEKMNHQDLVLLVVRQQTEVEKLRDKVSDLENYLDDLLVRVMETTPKILQTPYETLNIAFTR